ncbi:hypothetical protein B0A49_00909 [Cryomyces minteri]|uniref:Uncharacterized protein n=1 Tax=Cryomyces minteri TaxID=331657 RepID=A0A4V5NHR9_9PEZI|nr:hypothetical protein B0A49_00909 [Cryomyces minteri]
MSELDVVDCIAAVVSAFHGGAELMRALKKRNKKRKTEQAYKEKMLQEALMAGETQVKRRYAEEFNQLGVAFSKGDDGARHQLLAIAVSMQAEIIRSLQIAWEVENAILDLTKLHESAVMNRHSTVKTMDELRQRILIRIPIWSPIKDYELTALEASHRQSSDPTMTSATANAVAPDCIPSAVTIPEQGTRRGSLSRMFSMRGNNNSGSSRDRASSFSSETEYAPNSKWKFPIPMYKESQLAGTRLWPDNRRSISTASDHSSDKRPSILSVNSSSDSITPDSNGPIQAFYPNISPDGSDYLPSFDWSKNEDTRPPLPMHGRPCKQNNYWNFCKGAWSARESIKKGLEIHMVPDGLFQLVPHWQCRSCEFRSIAVGKAKALDPRVYKATCGIRYKWVFLAKSHVRNKSPTATKETYNYGCVFCSVDNKETGIYGSVDMLMDHIYVDHAGNITPDVAKLTDCVVGRVAGPEEAFDVNIPFLPEDRYYHNDQS